MDVRISSEGRRPLDAHAARLIRATSGVATIEPTFVTDVEIAGRDAIIWAVRQATMFHDRISAGHRHVGERQAVDVDPQHCEVGCNKTRAELGSRKTGILVSIVQSSVGGARRIRRPMRQSKPLHPPALLIDQRRRRSPKRRAYIVHQCAYRLRLRDVALEEDDPPRLRFAEECAFSVR